MMPSYYQAHKTEDMNFHQMINGTYDFTKPRPPVIIIFALPLGGCFVDKNESSVSGLGHVYIGVKGINPSTGKLEATTIGAAREKARVPELGSR